VRKLAIFLFQFFLFLNLIACVEEEAAPKDLLAPAKMSAILVDLHIAEAKIDHLNLKSVDSAMVAFQYLQELILEKHNTDTTQYFSSYDYYAKNMPKLQEIYQVVVDTLTQMEARAVNQEILFSNTPEAMEIVTKIKQLPDYQNDEIGILPNGRVFSKDLLIQNTIQQIYTIPENMNMVSKEMKENQIPEAVAVYKLAIIHYKNQYKIAEPAIE